MRNIKEILRLKLGKCNLTPVSNTHIFLLPLAVLQATVILVSYVVFRRRHKPVAIEAGD